MKKVFEANSSLMVAALGVAFFDAYIAHGGHNIGTILITCDEGRAAEFKRAIERRSKLKFTEKNYMFSVNFNDLQVYFNGEQFLFTGELSTCEWLFDGLMVQVDSVVINIFE